MRRLTAKIIAPVLRLTGFRFDKNYRWGTTLSHRIICRLVDTVGANIAADR